jgi:hypothetical protein
MYLAASGDYIIDISRAKSLNGSPVFSLLLSNLLVELLELKLWVYSPRRAFSLAFWL